MPRGAPTATLPSAASEVRADRRAPIHSTPYPIEVMYSGPHPSAYGAMVTETDQGSRTGSASGGFADPCSPRQPVERAVTSNLGGMVPTTMGA